MKTYFVHSKTKSGKRFTMAGKEKNGVMVIGLSVCSPRDHFVKKLGRTIAEGRADKRSYAVVTSVCVKSLYKLAEEFAENN